MLSTDNRCPSTELVGLLEVEAGAASSTDRLQLEHHVVHEALTLMMKSQYDSATLILRQSEEFLGQDNETLIRLLHVADSQRAQPMELRQPYQNTLNWGRCWELPDKGDVPVAPPVHEVYTSLRASPHVSTGHNETPFDAFVKATTPRTLLSVLDHGDDEKPVHEEQSPSLPVSTS
jgi:hypothetical protein